MARDSAYDILFQPVKIGPLTAKNRFYQVPHGNGMGHVRPASMIAMRGVKAEGGWAVVSSEEVEIHHSSEVSPYPEGRLWDETDIAYHTKMTEVVHSFDALAAIELVYQGQAASNRFSRTYPMSASSMPVTKMFDPVQTRGMDKEDFRSVRRWHRQAVLRAKRAGYDIIYIYASHNLSLIQHLISQRYNSRTDEYGGPIENRARLLREIVEETKSLVGDRCAVAIRFAVDELIGPSGITCEVEGREVIEMLAELPDLWDVNVSGWANDSATSRFSEEGHQEKYVAFVKKLTTKPVVGVGRFTSPDFMVSQIRRGVLDFIGAARPSIADPFLPKKIEEGRADEIRECIGCNICVSGDTTITPIRCTQNPTMGEEWRRGWHPEKIPPGRSTSTILIVGGGPTGLEAAAALGQRGYKVTLAEASAELGGRVSIESKLPGLSAWGRVRDYRTNRLRQAGNVDIFLNSKMTAADVLSFGADHILVATGAFWRGDGVGRTNPQGIPGSGQPHVATPEDVINGLRLAEPIILYDDDHYYLGSVLTELLVQRGCKVTYVTPAADVAHWTHYTLEQERIQARLLDLGVRIDAAKNITKIEADSVDVECIYTRRKSRITANSVVLVTARHPADQLWRELVAVPDSIKNAGIRSVTATGDCLAPGTIQAAVYNGHRFARELDSPKSPDETPFRREYVLLADS